MNRRDFFSGLAGTVALAALDPERLLWKPTKMIFLPPIRYSDPVFEQIDAITLKEFIAEQVKIGTDFLAPFYHNGTHRRKIRQIGNVYVALEDFDFVHNTSLELP